MNLYKSDFYAWTQQQAALLRVGNLNELDTSNLIEEIEDMGASERRTLESRLQVLLAHLLKWRYQPDYQSTSWEATIKEQRRKIQRLLKRNSALKRYIEESLIESYGDARLTAMKETQLIINTFPIECPWIFEQIIHDEFWPH